METDKTTGGISSLENLQEQFLKAMVDGDLKTFRRLLFNPAVDPTYKYGKPHFSTCLEIACRHPDRHEFVKELLGKVKPTVNHIVPEPIHYAAGRGNAEALAVLLRDKRTKVNAQDSAGRTALHHVAAKFPAGGDAEAAARYERCVALLLEHPLVDENRPSYKGFTPIHEAVSAGKHAVQVFLRNAKRDLDLDSARGHGRTARQAILAKFPELKDVLPQPLRDDASFSGRSHPQMRLVAELQRHNLQAFRQLLLQVDTDGGVMADPNHWYGKPINSTCLELACKEEDCEEFVEVLLKAGADPNTVNPITEKSPIHVAAERANVGALRILLADKRTNINASDCYDRTALHYAVTAKNGSESQYESCVKLLLSDEKLNVNIQDQEGFTPILAATFADNKTGVELMLKTRCESLDLHNIKFRDEKSVWNIVIEKYPEFEDHLKRTSFTVHALQPTVHAQLVQHLQKRQTKDFIEKINKQIQTNREIVNGDDGSYTFLQYACKHGLGEVVEVLLKSGADPNHTINNNKWPPIVIACSRGHHSIIGLFLNLPAYRKVDINATDMKGNTALHHAAKHGNLNTVLSLLSNGADIRVKNVFDKPPLPAKAVENLLNQCLKPDERHYPEEDEYKVLFDYEMLVPNKIHCCNDNIDDAKVENVKIESIGLRNIEGESHDTMVQFTEEKNFSSLNAEMDFLFYLSQSNEHRPLLKHPIITSFLSLKWYRIRFFHFLNLVFYSLFVFTLNLFILLEVEYEKEELGIVKHFSSANFFIHSNTYVIILTVLISGLALRELFQLFMSPSQYIRNVENILDLCVISFTGLTLYSNINNNEWRKTLTVMTVLLSWTELVILTGRCPMLSKNIQMLKTVSWTFFRFMIWYSLLIVAFGISFYTMFHDSKQKENSFKGIGTSLFKTFIMMTGEFNSDDKIPFSSFNLTEYILFIMFVFLIAIVLLNLLTGLAVSDTQAIQNDAELLSLISQIHLIYDIENTLLQWHNKMCRLRICQPLTQRFEKQIHTISLFPPSVPAKQICVLPNKGPDIILPNERCIKCKMDLDTLGAAMNIIGSFNKANDIDMIKNRLNIIEKCQVNSKQILDQILNKLDEIPIK